MLKDLGTGGEHVDSCVVKHFTDPMAFQAEIRVYRLSLPMIPRLFDYQEPEFIKMQRIDGLPYLDGKKSILPRLLGETIANFHRATLVAGVCLCHIDNQPRNILFDGTQYYLIDFSDSRYDHPEMDVTHLLLFWAVDFSHRLFISRAREFLDAYHTLIPIDKKRWKRCLKKNMEVFYMRRIQYGKSLGKSSKANIDANLKWLLAFAGQ